MDNIKTERLVLIKTILENRTAPAFERLCEAACVFLAAAADEELEERKKRGKGKVK